MNGKTRNETRNETALDDVSRARTNSGRQFGSLTRRSHQLIAHHQSPRLSSRFVVPPGSPFHRRPSSFIASSGLSAPRLVPSCRPVVLSSYPSCHFARLSLFLSSSRRGLSNSWRRIGSGGSRQRRRRRGFYAPFSPAHRSPCHQVLLVGGGV